MHQEARGNLRKTYGVDDSLINALVARFDKEKPKVIENILLLYMTGELDLGQKITALQHDVIKVYKQLRKKRIR